MTTEHSSDLPERVVVGANGAYWRDYLTHYSMCPVSEDNDPVVPVATYVRSDLAVLNALGAALTASGRAEYTFDELVTLRRAAQRLCDAIADRVAAVGWEREMDADAEQLVALKEVRRLLATSRPMTEASS